MSVLFQRISDKRNIKVRIMDLTDIDCEQTVKTTDGRHHSVLVLSEMETSERVGRVCRALKYQPKFQHRTEDSHEQHVCRTFQNEHAFRSDLEFHIKNHNNCRTGYRLVSRLEENKKREEETSSDQCSNDQTDFSHRKKFVCNLCGMEYVRNRCLVVHMRIHTGETPFKCDVCGKAFRCNDWLLKHMKIHKATPQENCSKKRYSCDYCEKVYTCRTLIRSHLRTHTGERPYNCTICPRAFHDKGSLTKHLVCHSDCRPYMCTECGHSFKRMGTLIKHQRIHTGEKPFSCSFCGKMFPYKFSLSTHTNSSRCQRLRAAKNIT